MENEGSLTNQQIRKNRPSRIFGQYVIKHGFQFKFSLIIFAILALSTLVMWLEGYLSISRMVDSKLILDDNIIQQLRLLNGIIGKTGIILIAFVFGAALFLSHFIAGPIYRFEKTFEEIRNGNLNLHVRLRKRDEFQDAADLFNQALISLRQKIRKERDGVDALINKGEILAQELRGAGQTDAAGELEKIINEFRNVPREITL